MPLWVVGQALATFQQAHELLTRRLNTAEGETTRLKAAAITHEEDKEANDRELDRLRLSVEQVSHCSRTRLRGPGL